VDTRKQGKSIPKIFCVRHSRGQEIQGVKHLQKTVKLQANDNAKKPCFSWKKEEKERNTLVLTHVSPTGALHWSKKSLASLNCQKPSKKNKVERSTPPKVSTV
jgi:hypothetical protein